MCIRDSAYGTMNLSDSVEVRDNKARRNGGGINARDGAVINMQEGTIDGNVSGQFGGGVYLKNSSVFNFKNGSICLLYTSCRVGRYKVPCFD